jgi:hypothetical protein
VCSTSSDLARGRSVQPRKDRDVRPGLPLAKQLSATDPSRLSDRIGSIALNADRERVDTIGPET